MSEEVINFKVGDVVQLKSGGPRMTITYVTERGTFECSWFNDAGKRSHTTLRAETLNKIEDPTPESIPEMYR